MGFDEIQFPKNLSYGSKNGPGFNTSIIETDSGQEERIARWNNARRRYDAGFSVRKYEDLFTVQKFFIARRGAASGFRFKDHLDFTTSNDGRGAHTNVDENIGTGDGTATQFQLVKRYTSGPVTRVRNITKPVAGSLLIAFDTVNQPSGFSFDTTTGIVTFTVAPGAGVQVTAGFEFDVPVRFGESADEMLQFTQEDFGSGSVDVDIPIVEIRDEGVIADEFFFGGARPNQAITANITMNTGEGRSWSLDPQSAGLKAILPDPTDLPAGGVYFFLSNTSGSNSLILEDNLGTTIATLTPGTTLEVILSVNTLLVKTWFAF